jgi:signal transduction histidine kinase
MTHLVAFSDASEAAIRLETAPDAPDIRITITDNGEGEDSSAAAARLARLCDELTAFGGRMDVTRTPTRGTKVVLTLPATGKGVWPPA